MCRSPIAEGILKDLLIDEAERISGPIPVKVMSAGTHAFDGYGASENATRVAAESGINLERHVSRLLNTALITQADLILTMEQNHTDFINRRWRGLTQVQELKRFSRSDSMPKAVDIKDPIEGGLPVYRETFNEIKREIVRIAPVILELARSKNRKDRSCC